MQLHRPRQWCRSSPTVHMLRILKDGELRSESTASSAPFNLSATIDAGLHSYEAQILWDSDSGHWTPAHKIQNIVCGDAFLIDGQSNAVACDYHGEQLGDLEKIHLSGAMAARQQMQVWWMTAALVSR